MRRSPLSASHSTPRSDPLLLRSELPALDGHFQPRKGRARRRTSVRVPEAIHELRRVVPLEGVGKVSPRGPLRRVPVLRHSTVWNEIQRAFANPRHPGRWAPGRFSEHQAPGDPRAAARQWREQALDKNHAVQDVSGDCQNKQTVVRFARLDQDEPVSDRRERSDALTLERHVRCRGCDNCRTSHSRLWYARAVRECKQAPRTWMVTLTLAPWARSFFRTRAVKAFNEGGKAPRHFWRSTKELIGSAPEPLDFEQLPLPEQAKLIEGEVFSEIRLYFARLRFRSKARFRTLTVCEPHQDGTPHHHILMHEVEGRLSNDLIEAEWKLDLLRDSEQPGLSNFQRKTEWRKIGHVHERLVGSWKGAGNYISKYVSKDISSRVRASEFYGEYDYATKAKAVRLPDGRLPEVERGALVTPEEEYLWAVKGLVAPEDAEPAPAEKSAARGAEHMPRAAPGGEPERGCDLFEGDPSSPRAKRLLRSVKALVASVDDGWSERDECGAYEGPEPGGDGAAVVVHQVGRRPRYGPSG